MSITQGWKTKQVNFSNAFVQARINEEVYMGLPSCFEGPEGESRDEVILHFKKSLYGLAIAPKLFFKTLKEALKSRGFVPSKVDPCMFVHKIMICLVYVDDCLFFGKSGKDIDWMIATL